MAERNGRIFVLAGTNGAGKSSVLGEMLLARGAEHFDPDVMARKAREADPSLTIEQANVLAWNKGRQFLERAIAGDVDYAHETTLGGDTIRDLLMRALEDGVHVSLWFVGLDSPERHLARVAARVAKGGHAIPERKIRERYESSRANVITLLPGLAELKVFDNSAEHDPAAGDAPAPVLLLHTRRRQIVSVARGVAKTWAAPIAQRPGSSARARACHRCARTSAEGLNHVTSRGA